MFAPHLWIGPPGCGKTWRLIDQFTAELKQGVAPEDIALVTFTRAARKEAMDRALKHFAFAASRFAWLRTIHSGAFHLLQLGRDSILEAERLREFAGRHGYELTVDGRRIDQDDFEPLIVRGRSRDDELLFAYEWGRNCRFDLEQTIARCPVELLSVPQFRLFVRRLEDFKREKGLLDFTDLLERVLEQRLRPGVQVAMIDEAHDLSPLQIAVCEMWFADCQRSYVCADDDQAIYGWQGASTGWIHELAKRRPPEVLSRSKRVPVTAHALAQRIIAPNVHRVPKQYEPAERLGRVTQADLDQALQRVAQSAKAFVLVRNRMFIARVARELLERVVPFVVEGWGGHAPLSDERAVRAVRLALKLERGEQGPFPTSDVGALLRFVPKSSDWLGPGAREHVRDRRGQGSYTRETLVTELGASGLLEVVEQQGAFASMPSMPREDRRYFERLVERHGNLPDPTTIVTTIHAAKGREAPLVVVLPDMTRTTWRDYGRGGAQHNEGENRVFYVAVTRTQDELVVVLPSSRRFFEFPKLPLVEGAL